MEFGSPQPADTPGSTLILFHGFVFYGNIPESEWRRISFLTLLSIISLSLGLLQIIYAHYISDK